MNTVYTVTQVVFHFASSLVVSLFLFSNCALASDSVKLETLEASDRTAEIWLTPVRLSILAYKNASERTSRLQNRLDSEKSRSWLFRNEEQIRQLETEINDTKPYRMEAKSQVAADACKFEMPCAFQRSFRDQGSFEKFPHLAQLCHYLTANLQEAYPCEGRWTTHHTVSN